MTGAWTVKDSTFYNGAAIKAWGLVVFNACINHNHAKRFEEELVKKA